MARFEQPEHEDTGRMGFLGADEPWDDSGRPRVKIVEPFWADKNEELDYLFAVEETRGMLPSERLETIRKKFGGGRLKRMPSAFQTRRERDAELQKLREQVARDRVTGEG